MTTTERLARMAISEARYRYGAPRSPGALASTHSAWAHMSERQREDAVLASAAHLIMAQDSSVPKYVAAAAILQSACDIHRDNEEASK